MMTRPIIFLDANAIWHRRLAEALALQVPLIAVNPITGFIPRQVDSFENGMDVVRVVLPPGWASTTAFIGQRMLCQVVANIAARFETQPFLVLSSPAYAPVAKTLGNTFPIISYTADDYRGYEGWGGGRVKRREFNIYSRANLSVFVSAALRERAIVEFGLSPNRTLLSPNATEHRFAERNAPLPSELQDIARPVVGMLGGLSERLDLDFVARVAGSSSIGTFLVVGPGDKRILERYKIFQSEKVIVTGYVPHCRIHQYAHAMDAAIIPYAKTEFNRLCSPVRLYDHLATGIPIFALDGCEQIDNGNFGGVCVRKPDELAELLEITLKRGLTSRRKAPVGCFWVDRARLFLKALEGVQCESDAAVGAGRRSANTGHCDG